MILVEIYVPSVDKNYDFSLDEYAYVEDIVYELRNMIVHKEQLHFENDNEELILGSYDKGRAIPSNATLNQFDVKSGERLFLV